MRGMKTYSDESANIQLGFDLFLQSQTETTGKHCRECGNLFHPYLKVAGGGCKCTDREPFTHDEVARAWLSHVDGRGFIGAEIYHPYWMMRGFGAGDSEANYFYLSHSVETGQDFIDLIPKLIDSGEWGEERIEWLKEWRTEAIKQAGQKIAPGISWKR